MTDRLMLAPRLDLPATAELMSQLKDHDRDVVLDLSEVSYFGALCIQVVIAAATAVRVTGHDFSIVGASDRVVEQLRVMGLTPESIAEGR
ncbi:STAS domain-containing protein [Sulfitobacter sp. D35]|uniref:STAS domain-containing protein n=1 Tax=Sulfitobacter sp. D35 TaxID=3083252 RepID=UPI00296F28D6|nr:STAS domain-containing protein [Sulfitobacter sp. D35]MDW4496491.1 STAS domain-containing protein [Sulfitobacter sp. D35]